MEGVNPKGLIESVFKNYSNALLDIYTNNGFRETFEADDEVRPFILGFLGIEGWGRKSLSIFILGIAVGKLISENKMEKMMENYK